MDGKQVQACEITGSIMHNFTTLKRLDMNKMIKRYEHAKDKQLYMKKDNEYPIDLIIGNNL